MEDYSGGKNREPLRLIILGEFDPESEPHSLTDRAVIDVSDKVRQPIESCWVSTSDINDEILSTIDALWIAPGSPYKNFTKTLAAIKYVREQKIPCLGTCGGFQHMILEYARNVLGITDANHAEYDPYASRLFISRLECSLSERWMEISLEQESQVAKAYRTTSAREKYYCNFGVNPEFVPALRTSELQIVGSDKEGEIRIVEINQHPFFVGTLFLPQANSTTAEPHPLIMAFFEAASVRKNALLA